MLSSEHWRFLPVEPHLPAAILIMSDRPHPEKQVAVALAAIADYDVKHLCHHWQDCMALALSRDIVAVICAIDPGPEVRAALERAGTRLVVAREQSLRIRRTAVQLIRRLRRKGLEVNEIAEVLDIDTGEIRNALRDVR
jgi:hypothetical protein